MAINYLMEECSRNLATSTRKGLIPRVYRKMNITIGKLDSRLAGGSHIRKTELKLAIELVREQIILELLDGNSVTLDEFGTFSVSAATDKAVTNPEEIRSASIYVKNVNFIPSPRLMKRMETARFERKTK